MPLSKLTAPQIKPLLSSLNDELGKADQQRILALLDIHTDSTLNYATAISALFPDHAQEKAQNNFRSFRSRLNNAAHEIGVLLKLEVDSNKRSDPTERECWFEGEDNKVAQIAEYSREEASDQDSENLVPSRGHIAEKDLHEKPLIKLFTSYAHKDNRGNNKVTTFIEDLMDYFKASKHFRYEHWGDRDILIGEDWHSEIKGALKDCDFGLMMMSVSFISSDYINKHELPELLTTGKALPVAFNKFNFDTIDMKGLNPIQIFRYNEKFYSHCTGNRKSEFIEGLFQDIEKRILKLRLQKPTLSQKTQNDRLIDTGSKPVTKVESTYCSQTAIEKAVKIQADPGSNLNYISNRAHAFGITTDVDLTAQKHMKENEKSIVATEYLMDWASNQYSPPFCALLGESGMGKTTTLKDFTRQLLEQRPENNDLPLPIYIDLREYTWDKTTDFDLYSILTHILNKSWKGGNATSTITPEDIINQVQENRALIIWDGLDEVIVHMGPKHANDFIRQLWRILPPLKQDKAKYPNSGKMLISCRSHYFRDVSQQNNMLTSEHRDGIKSEDYQALILLPFGTQQIEAYLQKSLKVTDAELSKTIDLISSVHNLSEMAERPYTLSLIAQHIPQIEELSSRGEVIQGVTLYKSMVDNWLARDTGKHQFSPLHKKQLMEYLAAALWRTGQRQWTVDDLDDWLDDFLYDNPRIAGAYTNMDREVLKEDLRTATFITRPDDEHFRFAHTSLQEFFLASYLHRGLYEKKRENWQLFSEENSALPSNETLDFMVQLYTSEPKHQPKCKQSMISWLGESDSQSSQLLFKVWLILTERNEIIPFNQLSLPNADLSYWQIKGTAQRNLIIHDADLSHAKLDHIVFDYVQFKNCNFNLSNLWLAEFQHCRFNGCQFNQANLAASLWRHNDLTSLTLQECKTTHSQWIANKNQNELWPNSQARPQSFVNHSKPIGKTLLVHPTVGHKSTVHSTAFGPDGQYFATGSDDNTIKLWEISSGRCINTFEGHSDSVNSVAICPEGKYIISGSRDNTIKLWEISSRRCIHTFDGHSTSVSSVKFSPDGKYIASGAGDKTIKLWEINGRCAHTFKEQHSGTSNPITFSPDSELIAFGANDNTIKLWNINNKRYIYTFKEHSDSSNPITSSSVTFSPDGKYIASGAENNIRLWDINNRCCTHIFEGHHSIVSSIAFNPDGKFIVSGDHGSTIKLWEINSGCCINTMKGENSSNKPCTIFSTTDGIHTVLIAYRNNIELWDVNNRNSINTFKGHSDFVTSIALSPSDKKIASVDNGGNIKLWNTKSGHCITTIPAHSKIARSIAFSPDGNHLASGALDDNTIKIWNIESGVCTKTFEGRAYSTSSVTFNPKYNQIAAAGLENTAKLWDINSGRCVSTFQGHTSNVNTVVFSPNGDYIASGSNDKNIKLWETNSGNCIKTLEGHSNSINTVAFSPDGNTIASGSSDNSVKLWDISNGCCTHTFNMHTNSVNCIAFSPNGKYLVSGAHDRIIKLWDVSSGHCIYNLTAHSGGIRSVGFSHSGKHIVSSANDNTIKFWNADDGKLLRSTYQLPKNNTATIDEQSGKIIHGSKEAWRYFCYKDPTENTLDATLYPAEIYGLLPGSDK